MTNRRIFRLDDELNHQLDVAVVRERKSASLIIRKALEYYLSGSDSDNTTHEIYSPDPLCSGA